MITAPFHPTLSGKQTSTRCASVDPLIFELLGAMQLD
jgi:hypothetical protein